MPLHLMKLAVGVADLDHLKVVQAARRRERKQPARSPHWIFTRNCPKRTDEVLAGGSLYWVVKGVMRCRQEVVGFEVDNDADGRRYCRVKLRRTIVRTAPKAMNAFQGWRYLAPENAPPDLTAGDSLDLSDEMAADLRRLGLL